MKVAELVAGAGYTAELLSHAVAPDGTVYGENPKVILAGSWLAEVKTLHRIDEVIVKDEVEHAGFKLLTEDSFLRNPSDTRDWNDSPQFAGLRRGTSDRFALIFVKPS